MVIYIHVHVQTFFDELFRAVKIEDSIVMLRYCYGASHCPRKLYLMRQPWQGVKGKHRVRLAYATNKASLFSKLILDVLTPTHSDEDYSNRKALVVFLELLRKFIY